VIYFLDFDFFFSATKKKGNKTNVQRDGKPLKWLHFSSSIHCWDGQFFENKLALNFAGFL
jgi:hypothetical protein